MSGRNSYAPRTPGRKARSTYSFPLLKNSEILECMPNLGIQMSDADLTEPTPFFVQGVYETFVDLLAGITKEEINQPQFSGLGELPHPELHEESIPRLALFRATANLLEVSGCFGFRMVHLLRPTYKTFRSHLSGLINFAKFREERAITYTAFTTETDQLLESKAQLEEDANTILQQVEELRTEKQAKMPEITELQGSCQALEAEINTLNKQQAVLRHTHEGMKQGCRALRSKTDEGKQALQEVQDEADRLRSQIVHSPGRLEQESKNLEQLLEAEKAECEALERRRRGMQDRLATFRRQEKETGKAMMVLKDVAGHIAKCKASAEAKEDIESKITSQRMEAQDLEVMKQHLARQIKRHATRGTDIRQQYDVKNEAAQQALSAARQDLESQAQRTVTVDAELARARAEIAAVRLAVELAESAHLAKMDGRREYFKGLLTQVGKYNAQIMQAVA